MRTTNLAHKLGYAEDEDQQQQAVKPLTRPCTKSWAGARARAMNLAKLEA